MSTRKDYLEAKKRMESKLGWDIFYLEVIKFQRLIIVGKIREKEIRRRKTFSMLTRYNKEHTRCTQKKWPKIKSSRGNGLLQPIQGHIYNTDGDYQRGIFNYFIN